MQTKSRSFFTAVRSEGSLLPMDLLQRIRSNDSTLPGLDEKSYHIPKGKRLKEEINRSWNRLSGCWAAFKKASGKLSEEDSGTTLTRERWLLPLFEELGFGNLAVSKAIEIDGKTYPISHRWQHVPIHLVGCKLPLDKRSEGRAGAARLSPHSLLQEYLNLAKEAQGNGHPSTSQWGMVSNGLLLRLLRENASLTRQAYLEFDLETMFEGEIYADFALLWLICHHSRFEVDPQEEECLLDQWFKNAQETGIRALDDLRNGVEEAIKHLGQGFPQHPLNGELREKLRKGELSVQDYYRQLLRLVYRLLFLFVAEDRDLLLKPDAPPHAKKLYMQYYSATRLRALAEKQPGSHHHDLYEALLLIFTLLGSPQGCPQLGLAGLGGFLFDPTSTKDLNQAKLSNKALLSAVRSLAFIQAEQVRRAVDYRNLGTEELGSVYESLLELYPQLNANSGGFELITAGGNERKTSGSYYTPASLIRVLLDSALEPLIEARLKSKGDKQSKEQALLSLKICDPACGSGHFLIAAAHRIGAALAKLRADGNEPSPLEMRRALRDVINQCLYGVDVNPMAVELCKVNLWLEALEAGKPLSFLDAHIKCGNSLVGVGPWMDLNELEVPDEAFVAVEGDDEDAAGILKKRNRSERKGQESLFFGRASREETAALLLAKQAQAAEALPQDTAAEVQAKAEAFHRINASQEYARQRQIADLWTAAFFWKIKQPENRWGEITAPTQGQLRSLRSGKPCQAGLLEEVERLREKNRFFHWVLEFPQVFLAANEWLGLKEGLVTNPAEPLAAGAGFDCVLGNPPWERIKLQELEFFAVRDPQIAAAPNKAEREKRINQLKTTNPDLWQEFMEAKHVAACNSKFMRHCGRYPLTARGDINTYALFAEHFRSLMNRNGRAAIILPTGIATDDTYKIFFKEITEKGNLLSLMDFENREALFPDIDNRMKFCLLTLTAEPQERMEFVCYAGRVQHLQDARRRVTLARTDFSLFNPNSGTLPPFRSRADADINRYIYQRLPVLEEEGSRENPWELKFLSMFHMTNDSGLFSSTYRDGTVPLYEAKLFWQFDHRWATYEGKKVRDVRLAEKQDPYFAVQPRYWVPQKEMENRLKEYPHGWLLALRNVARATDQRTAICALLPKAGVGNTAALLLGSHTARRTACLLGSLNSVGFDYTARCKVGGMHMDYYIIKQLPVLPPAAYRSAELEFIVPRVLELSYTAVDLQPYAQDVLNEVGYAQWQRWFPHNPLGADGSPHPFRWDEERRARLRAELDAYYARLYGLNHKQLRYILDPADLTPRELQDVLDPEEEVEDALEPEGYKQRAAESTYPSQTFRALKDEEMKAFGEYRTRRLILEAWERLKEIDLGLPEGERQPAAALEIKTQGASQEMGEPMGVKTKEAAKAAEAGEPIATKAKQAGPNGEEDKLMAEKTGEAKIGGETDELLITIDTQSDMCIYKCSECKALVLGFERENHILSQHQGKQVQWKKTG